MLGSLPFLLVNRKKIMFSITLKIIQLCAGDPKHLPHIHPRLLPGLMLLTSFINNLCAGMLGGTRLGGMIGWKAAVPGTAAIPPRQAWSPACGTG